MTAPSPLLTRLNQRLQPSSLQLLQQAGVLSTAAIPAADPATTNAPTAATVVTAPVNDAVPSVDLSDDEKATIFESVLDRVEASHSSSLSPLLTAVPPQALPQATEDLWQQQPGGKTTTSKERAASGWSLDAAVQEAGGALAAVELEKSPEIPPEVETYLQRVEDHQQSPAQELITLIPTVATAKPTQPMEVVRVLPVTEKTMKAGAHKSPKFSIRWLVEWSDKIIKMFKGKAVYRS